jgi:hypothetical protein
VATGRQRRDATTLYSPRLRWLYPALFVVGLVVYGFIAGTDRLGHQSGAPHFVFQADAWLHGQASIDPPWPNDDWAMIETVALRDGREVRGRRMVTEPMFRTLAGDKIPSAQIARSVGRTTQVSFPFVPTAIMLPSALLFGRTANDVVPTIVIAALILPLALLLLRRLAAAKLSARSVGDDLWLVAALGFGSVMLFSAVQGKVWYTAHVVGVVLALIYAWGSIEAKHPVLAGLALGAAALTRTPMAFMFPLFVLEAWRISPGIKMCAKRLVPFAIPVVAFAIAGMIYNQIRFESPTEFGHGYLALGTGQPVRQQFAMETYGLFSLHYLARNLVVAFGLTPGFALHAPWVQISGHGLAIWVTTPILLALLVWPREANPIRRALWITTGLVAVPSLLYMNTGWIQFGYRFSLDYLVFLILLLAIASPRLSLAGKLAIGAGILINLFGALTFDRAWKYYRYGGDAFDVVAHDATLRLVVMAVVLVAAAGFAVWRRRASR